MKIWVELDNKDRASIANYLKDGEDNFRNANEWLDDFLDSFEYEFYLAIQDALRDEYS